MQDNLVSEILEIPVLGAELIPSVTLKITLEVSLYYSWPLWKPMGGFYKNSCMYMMIGRVFSCHIILNP